MNLIKPHSSFLILVISIVLIILIVLLPNRRRRYSWWKESFVNYPDQVDPTAKPSSNSEATTANENYASILMFMKDNPSQSVKFIEDVKQKFFQPSCRVRDDIDFPHLASFSNGAPFGS